MRARRRCAVWALEENPEDKAARILHESCLAKLAMVAKESATTSAGPSPEAGGAGAGAVPVPDAGHDTLSTQELPVPSGSRDDRQRKGPPPAGKPNLLEPEGVEAEVRWFIRVPARDPAFMARHKADRMCLFIGRGTVGGKTRQYGVLCLNRGQESWRMVAVVRGDVSEASVGPCAREEKWAKTLGRFFGTFRILSDE